MRFTSTSLLVAVGLSLGAAPLAAQTTAAPTPPASADPIERIKEEGLKRSQVMATLSYLTDVIGPRLTGSPALKRANEWTRDELTRYGLQNAHLERWGPFGRGWTLQSFAAEVTAPQPIALIAYPKAWSPGVELANAEVMLIDAKTPADLEKYRGQLRGKIVLNGGAAELKPHFEAEATRKTDKQLLDLADAPVPGPAATDQASRLRQARRRAVLAGARNQFFLTEGVGLVLDPSPSGDGGTVFVAGAAVPQVPDTASMMSMFLPRRRAWDATPVPNFAQAVVAAEHYNRLVRLIQAGAKPTMSVKLAVRFNDNDLNAYNTIAEVPGTDKKSELVMVGGHLDSWHGGTGATDNAAGVAVAMEAVRILKALNLTPRRTIRVALWTGEEQGLFGSRAYVAEHFGAPAVAQTPEQQMATMLGTATGGAARLRTKPEYDKLSAYFNLDNGAGKIRGVYLQGNEAVRPIFRQWLAPLKELGATTLTAANTGSTDHVSFDALGLPGFQFIQDNLEYGTRTHHSTQDLYDRVPAEDLQQAATVMAAFLYQAAMRDERLPRKPAPGTEKAPAGKRKKGLAAR